MNERTQYQQLQPEKCQTIASLHLQGSSIRAMARILGRSPATVSRELTRNSSAVGYASVPAKTLSVARRSAGRRPNKLCLQGVCWRVVLTLLEWKWSPQQISGTLKRMYPTDSTQHVSHETIYTAIYAQPRGELRRQLMPACATATAHACHAHGAQTGADRFPTWSVSTCDRPKSKTDCCRVTGKATPSRVPTINPRSAFWSNGPAAWCCSPRWKTPPPLQR